jgi:hypothetical protein
MFRACERSGLASLHSFLTPNLSNISKKRGLTPNFGNTFAGMNWLHPSFNNLLLTGYFLSVRYCAHGTGA